MGMGMTDKYPELERYKTLEIPIEVIYLDRDFNCRGVFTPQSCVELSESMRLHGLKIPIIVQPWEIDYEYRIIAGHRRYTAAKYLLQWSHIPATVITGLSEDDASLLNLIENLERKDLSLIQEARALRKKYPADTPMTHIARDLSKSDFWVKIRWKLMDMPQDVQDLVEQGAITSKDLAQMLYKSAEEQIILASERALAKAQGISTGKFFKLKGARNKTEIQAMLTKLMMEGVTPNGHDALSWAAGFLTDEELLA
jgi:ParB family chromosome partitioning protein